MSKKKRTRRKSIKGRVKGMRFERDICKKLSQWWTGKDEEVHDDVFWRSAGSGATATARTKRKKRTFGQYGDIQANDPIGQPLLDCFTIELKCGYSDFSMQDLFDKPETQGPSQIEEFIEQAAKSSTAANTPAWMIIFRRDRKDAVIFIKRTKKIEHILSRLRGNPEPYGAFNFYNKTETKFYKVFVTTLTSLFELSPDVFKE